MPFLASLALILAQTPPSAAPQVRTPLSLERMRSVGEVIEKWRSRFAPTFSSLSLDPEQLATETRQRLAGMNPKSAKNQDVVMQTLLWLGPTTHSVVGFNEAEVTQATKDLLTAAGVQGPANLPRTMKGRPNGLILPNAREEAAPVVTGVLSGSTVREYDLTLPLQERSTPDGGSTFPDGNTLQMFNSGQAVNPNWATKISFGQLLPFELPTSEVAVEVKLSTDRLYMVGALGAYATISSGLTVSLQDENGKILSSQRVDLGGATAPFIGQFSPHTQAPLTISVPAIKTQGLPIKLVIAGDSGSTLLGPGVVSEDVRVTVTRVRVSWIPSPFLATQTVIK